MSDLFPGPRAPGPRILALTSLHVAAPSASSMLGALQAWMGRHSRTITVVICFVFGRFSSGASWEHETERGK